jgi:SNF2 family DNA or RNA helicase
LLFFGRALSLKPYQLVGVNWLLLLHEKNVNAILADAMGLGKTIQTIAFFAHMRTVNAGSLFGVIAPSSTLENWEREFALWCPSLRVACIRGL